MEVLKVNGLTKTYPLFKLDGVSFSLDKGKIMGFIGRNGAGKTTTLKSLLNQVHPDSGTISFFGKSFAKNEQLIKQKIGFASGGVNYYFRTKIKKIVEITKLFYDEWDEKAYRKYLERFQLDENKKPIELSEGMKVKLNLALALSHKAELLILDEPTSGLDPVSREEILEIFLELADEGVSILFSTHITSDLEKCAEYITYIRNGKIIASDKTNDFVGNYKLVKLPTAIPADKKDKIIGINRSRDFLTALIKSSDETAFFDYAVETPTLEEIMTHIEKEGSI